MEHTGYILFLPDSNSYYNSSAMMNCPFEADFYLSKDEAVKTKANLERLLKTKIRLIKVKRTMKVLEFEE